MRRALLIGLLCAYVVGAPSVLRAQSTLEGPIGFVSGLNLVSGWKCSGGTLTFSIDGGPSSPLAYGSSRNDTQGICGDSNNGFGALFNFNLVGNGQHTIRVFDNGQQFAQANFTVTTLGTEFLTGAASTASATINGKNVTLTWQQNQQNFVITSATGGGGYPSVGGTWSTSMSYVSENCNFLSVPPDLPTQINDTLTVTQNGKSLTIVSAPPSLTFTGDLKTNGDFTTTSSPQAQTASTCTFALAAGLGGNFLSGSGALVFNVSYVSGSCPGLSLPCSVNYAGSLTKVSAASANETESAGEPSLDGAMDTIGGAMDIISQGLSR